MRHHHANHPGSPPADPAGGRISPAAFLIVDEEGTVVRASGWEKTFGVPAPERIEPHAAGRDRLLACLMEAIAEAATTGALVRRTAEMDDPPQRIDIAAASLAIGGGGASTAFLVEPRGAGGETGAEGQAICGLEHDLRSPLTSISGAAELLETGRLGAINAQQARCLEVIHKGVDGLLRRLEAAAAPYRRAAAPARPPAAAPGDDAPEPESR
jgi:signal transduction histidine kinase